MEGWEKTYHVNINQKNINQIKVDLGAKNITRDKLSNGTIIMNSIHQKKNHKEDKMCKLMCKISHHNRTSKYMKHFYKNERSSIHIHNYAFRYITSALSNSTAVLGNQ